MCRRDASPSDFRSHWRRCWDANCSYGSAAPIRRSCCISSTATARLLRERLNNGRLDIAVLLVDQPERGLAVEPLVLEELFYVTADQDNSPVHIADAAQRPLLVPGPDSGIQRDARKAFEKHGLPLVPIGECDSLNTLRELVASGIGNSIMTWSGLHGGDPRLALNYRRFVDAKMVRPVSLCFSEVGLRSPAIEAVALTLKLLVRELVESGAWQGVTLIAPDAEPSGSPARRWPVKAGHRPGGRAVLRRRSIEK